MTADPAELTTGSNGGAAEVLLELRGIHTYYGRIHALQGVSLEVRRGEIVTLIGANGAGKTTILKTICGLLHAREGKVLFGGRTSPTGRPTISSRPASATLRRAAASSRV